jgi:hypothetical protein
MSTYIVKVKTVSEYLVVADSPEEALWDFGYGDASSTKEKIKVYDENGKKLLTDPPKNRRD